MNTTETEPRRLHGAAAAPALEALERSTDPEAAALLRLLIDEAEIVWVCPSLASLRLYRGERLKAFPGHPDPSATLIAALYAHADRYQAEGLGLKANHCYWLAAKLRAGELLICGRRLLDRLRGLEEERTAATRRARDLARWQREADQRYGLA